MLLVAIIFIIAIAIKKTKLNKARRSRCYPHWPYLFTRRPTKVAFGFCLYLPSPSVAFAFCH
jgi:hypothetical protein